MNAIFQEIVKENGEIRALRAKMTGCLPEEAGQDKDAVGKMLKLALEHKKAKERGILFQPLRQLSSDSCLNMTYGGDMLMNAAFLVDRAWEKEFDGEVEKLVAWYSDRIEFKYVGPVPPYSFVNIVVE
jgi:hypothetical protein